MSSFVCEIRSLHTLSFKQLRKDFYFVEQPVIDTNVEHYYSDWHPLRMARDTRTGTVSIAGGSRFDVDEIERYFADFAEQEWRYESFTRGATSLEPPPLRRRPRYECELLHSICTSDAFDEGATTACPMCHRPWTSVVMLHFIVRTGTRIVSMTHCKLAMPAPETYVCRREHMKKSHEGAYHGGTTPALIRRFTPTAVHNDDVRIAFALLQREYKFNELEYALHHLDGSEAMSRAMDCVANGGEAAVDEWCMAAIECPTWSERLKLLSVASFVRNRNPLITPRLVEYAEHVHAAVPPPQHAIHRRGFNQFVRIWHLDDIISAEQSRAWTLPDDDDDDDIAITGLFTTQCTLHDRH